MKSVPFWSKIEFTTSTKKRSCSLHSFDVITRLAACFETPFRRPLLESHIGISKTLTEESHRRRNVFQTNAIISRMETLFRGRANPSIDGSPQDISEGGTRIRCQYYCRSYRESAFVWNAFVPWCDTFGFNVVVPGTYVWRYLGDVICAGVWRIVLKNGIPHMYSNS